MIAKHIPMREQKRSDYAELVSYLLDPHTKNERVGQIRVTNCQSTDPMVAAIEVLNTQSLNQRATGDKTYHLILSFRAGEEPDATTLKALEERVCGALGYADHQRVSVVHHDTDNLHVHLAINKIHPARHTMHTPFNDHITLGKVCQRLEREYGLQRDNHVASKRPGENEASDMEHHAGIESLVGWIKRECWVDLQRATSWAALHAVLNAHDLTLKLKSNGFVIQSGDGTTIKASSLAREFSKAALEKRLGVFEPDTSISPDSAAPQERPAEPPAAKRYERKPVDFGVDTQALYEHYKAEREQYVHDKQRDWSAARERKDLLIEGAKRSAKLKRNVIKLAPVGRFTKMLLYAAVSRTLVSTIGQAHQQYKAERRHLQQKYRRLTWADWLQAQAQRGNEQALHTLRSRKGAGSSGKNTLSGRHRDAQQMAGADSITKHGTVIICAGTTVLRDDGAKLTVSRIGDPEGLRTALKVAAGRYGKCLRVDGSAEFREQIVRAAVASGLDITFDDTALEARRTALIRATANKEKEHEHQKHLKGRPSGRSVPPVRTASDRGATGGAKPDVGGIGQRPPPQSKNRLRSLSQLGMVRIPGGGEVLLPGDVPGHVEQQGPAADHGLRRHVPRAGGLADAQGTTARARSKTDRKAGRNGPAKPPPLRAVQLQLQLDEVAAGSSLRASPTAPPPSTPMAPTIAKHEISAISAPAKYVFEREQRRLTISDIPKHLVYDGFLGEVRFAGLRTLDGQHLALLDRAGEIHVTAIDEATQRRLCRIARGDQVVVGKNGTIRRKGRSR